MIKKYQQIPKVLFDFLETNGIQSRYESKIKNNFLTTVAIKQGVLFYNDQSTLDDFIHEAGHLACIPKCFHRYLTGNLANTDYQTIGNQLNFDLNNLISDEQCSLGWSYFICKHLNIDVEFAFDDMEVRTIPLQIEAGFLTSMGSAPSCALYYGGFSAKKNSRSLVKFTLD